MDGDTGKLESLGKGGVVNGVFECQIYLENLQSSLELI